MRLRCVHFLVAFCFGAAVVVSACGGGRPSPRVTGNTTLPPPAASVASTVRPTITPTPSHLATPTLPPFDNYDMSTRTGMADVDGVLDAVMAGTAEALKPLLRYVSVPCVEPNPSSASRRPDACEPGMDPGDPITGFPVYDVEGGLIPPAGAPVALNGFLSRQLYGVFRYSQPQPSGIADRDYGIVFLDVVAPVDLNHRYYGFVSLDVKGAAIVALDFFPDAALMRRPDDPSWILSPFQLPPPPPTGP